MATVTPTAEKQESPEAVVEAGDLIAKGKRNLVCGEVPQAVNQFQEACRLLAAKHGETADECGEAYFLYGKALLDMARVESGVLGNALQGVPEDEEAGETENAEKGEEKIEKEAAAEGEDMEKIREQVFDAMGEREEEVAARKKEGDGKEEKDVEMSDVKGGDAKSEENQKKEGKDEVDETEEKKESDKKEPEVEVAEEAKEDEKKETGEEGGEEEGEEEEEDDDGEEGEESKDKSQDSDAADDIPNLQLAWEMLELAKLIFSRQEGKEMKLKAAEAHLKLGEVGLETEQYEQAIGDLTQCLSIQKEHLESDDRLLAETYYQLGLAYSFNAQFDESIENFRHATTGIEAKIAKLNKFLKENETGKGKSPAKADDPIANAHQEIKDLKEILPDILAKIEDAEEEKKNKDKVKQMVKDNMATSEAESTTTIGFGEASSTSEQSEKKETTNVMHLVRKKRKPEEDQEAADTKKPRQEDGASGDASTTEKSENVTNGNGETATNGSKAENGSGDKVTNGAVNGNGVHKSPDKTEDKPKEIVAKTVEDVQKAKEGEEKMDTEAAS